jgi:chromosome segregation ATPase
VGEDDTRGRSRPEDADLSSESGWVTTDVAAKAVRVSPRTIRRYIDQGKLEAKPQGEGVRREWLVSVDSLHALRASRPIEEDVPEEVRSIDHADSIADVLREMSARLESRAEEAAELRVRLELTERAQSTLEDERRQTAQELEEERRRREEAERQREDLRRELEALRAARESEMSPGPTNELGEVQEELGTERTRREMAESTLREGMDEERRRREEAERERDELRRELYGLREVPDAAEPAEEQQGRGEPRPAERGAQETSESLAGRGSGTARGSLWRRLFGR